MKKTTRMWCNEYKRFRLVWKTFQMQKRIKSITGKNELFRDGRYSNKNKDYTVYYDLVKPMSC